jgi:hypothetical protein
MLVCVRSVAVVKLSSGLMLEDTVEFFNMIQQLKLTPEQRACPSRELRPRLLTGTCEFSLSSLGLSAWPLIGLGLR